MTPDEAAAAVARAWNDAGIEPFYHQMMQHKLAQEWPVLALAVAQLAAVHRDSDR